MPRTHGPCWVTSPAPALAAPAGGCSAQWESGAVSVASSRSPRRPVAGTDPGPRSGTRLGSPSPGARSGLAFAAFSAALDAVREPAFGGGCWTPRAAPGELLRLSGTGSSPEPLPPAAAAAQQLPGASPREAGALRRRCCCCCFSRCPGAGPPERPQPRLTCDRRRLPPPVPRGSGDGGQSSALPALLGLYRGCGERCSTQNFAASDRFCGRQAARLPPSLAGLFLAEPRDLPRGGSRGRAAVLSSAPGRARSCSLSVGVQVKGPVCGRFCHLRAENAGRKLVCSACPGSEDPLRCSGATGCTRAVPAPPSRCGLGVRGADALPQGSRSVVRWSRVGLRVVQVTGTLGIRPGGAAVLPVGLASRREIRIVLSYETLPAVGAASLCPARQRGPTQLPWEGGSGSPPPPATLQLGPTAGPSPCVPQLRGVHPEMSLPRSGACTGIP